MDRKNFVVSKLMLWFEEEFQETAGIDKSKFCVEIPVTEKIIEEIAKEMEK